MGEGEVVPALDEILAACFSCHGTSKGAFVTGTAR
jgi:hypothetical protein